MMPAVMAWMISCNNTGQKQARVIGDFSYTNGNKVYLHELLPQKWPVVDSAVASEEGKVSFQLNDTTAGFYTLGTDRENLLILIVKPGDEIKVTADIRQIPYTFDTQGPESIKVLERFRKQTNKNLSAIDSLSRELSYHRDSAYYPRKKQKTDSMIANIYDKQKEFQLKLVKNHKDKLAVLIPLFHPFGQKRFLTIEKYPELFREIDNTLSERYPNNPHVLSLHKRVMKYNEKQSQADKTEQKIQPGKKAPDFSLQNTKKENVRLSDLDGKYVVLDFWSEENPSFRQRQKDLAGILWIHRSMGMMHYSIYRGKDKLVWRNIAEKYPRQSIHALAEPVVLKMYNARDKNRTFLVDPDGKIIAKDFKIGELKHIINQKLKSEPES